MRRETVRNVEVGELGKPRAAVGMTAHAQGHYDPSEGAVAPDAIRAYERGAP